MINLGGFFRTLPNKLILMKYPILLICSLILLIAGGCDSDPEPGIVLDPKGEAAARLGIDFECSRGEVQIYFKIVGHAKPSAEVMANGDNTGDWINTFFSRTDNGWTLGIGANENEGFYERRATVRLSAGDSYYTFEIRQDPKIQVSTSFDFSKPFAAEAKRYDAVFRSNGELSFQFVFDGPEWIKRTVTKEGDNVTLSMDFPENPGVGKAVIMKVYLNGKNVLSYTLRQAPAEFPEDLDIILRGAGELFVQLGDDIKNIRRIKKLSIYGDMNSLDFQTLRQLFFRNEKNTPPDLSLDLSGVNVVRGDRCPYPELVSQIPGEPIATIDNYLPDYAFKDAANLASIELPFSIEQIGTHCFEYCLNLKTITIPDNVRAIWIYPFMHCRSLHEIKMTEYSLLTTIYGCAFTTPGRLNSLYLPETLTNVDNDSFVSCRADSLIVNWQEPPLFPAIPHTRNCTLFVPQGTKELYEASPCWGKFENIVEQNF